MVKKGIKLYGIAIEVVEDFSKQYRFLTVNGDDWVDFDYLFPSDEENPDIMLFKSRTEAVARLEKWMKEQGWNKDESPTIRIKEIVWNTTCRGC